MATATLTNVPTTISLAESITGWTNDTFVLEPDIKVQGGNSVSCSISPNAGANQDIYYTGFTAANLNAVHLRLWFNISFIPNLATTNPIKVFISDGTNTAYWAIDSSAYSGGWLQAVVYTGNTPLSGTRPAGNSTRVGMNFSVATKPRTVTNAWFDAWYYGNGYTITGGTSGDEINWSHVAAVDKTNAYGVVSFVGGVYFLAGYIKIGASGTVTRWKDTNQICIFKNLPVSASLYWLYFTAAGAGVTDSVTISGGITSGAGYGYYAEDLIDTFSITGRQISNAKVCQFKDEVGSIYKINNCVFDSGTAMVSSFLSEFKENTISNNTGTTAFNLPANSQFPSSLKFINNNASVLYSSGSDQTDPTFDNFIFDDVSGKYDVYNITASSVTINLINGSNANSYNPVGSAVTFSASFSLELTSVIEGTQVTIVNSSTRTELQNSIAPASGIITYTHTGGETVDILIMDLDYDPNLSDIFDLTLPYSNSSIKFQMIEDVNYDNPI